MGNGNHEANDHFGHRDGGWDPSIGKNLKCLTGIKRN